MINETVTTREEKQKDALSHALSVPKAQLSLAF